MPRSAMKRTSTANYSTAGEQHLEDKAIELPDYHEARTTKRICVAALILSYPLSITCLIIGAYLIHLNNQFGNIADGDLYDPSKPSTISTPNFISFKYSRQTFELLRIVIILVVTFVTEALGYIHTVSLRWSLWQEGRLRYNSNIRLFCHTRSSWANSWCANTAWGATLVLAYAAASTSLNQLASVGTFDFGNEVIWVEGVSLTILGACILIQTILAHMCISLDRARVVSWSSDPLNTALATLHFDGSRAVDADTTAMSAPSVGKNPGYQKADYGDNSMELVRPKLRQASILTTDRDTRWPLRLAWLLLPACLVWATVMLGISRVLHATVPTTIPVITSGGNGYVPRPENVALSIIILAGFQMFGTLALHCAEVITNRSRDEQQWRRLCSTKGCTTPWSSISNAFTSWQSVILFLFKSVVHFVFGQTMATSTDVIVTFHYRYIYGLFGALFALAVYITLLAGHKPKGPQPSTYGHLPTLRSLIDDWGAAGTEKREENLLLLFWGDKGELEDSSTAGLHVRCAGTSGKKSDVGQIDMDAVYKWFSE